MALSVNIHTQSNLTRGRGEVELQVKEELVVVLEERKTNIVTFVKNKVTQKKNAMENQSGPPRRSLPEVNALAIALAADPCSHLPQQLLL